MLERRSHLTMAMEHFRMTLCRRSLLCGLAAAAGAVTPAATAKSSQIKDLWAAVQNAIEGDGVLDLPAGDFSAPALEIGRALTITGVRGRTRIISPDGGPAFIITTAEPVVLTGLTFDGGGKGAAGAALVQARAAASLDIADCTFGNSLASGLRLEGSGGRITGNSFERIGGTAIFALDSTGLEISGNTIRDIGNNGIQVWTSVPREDGTIVTRNRIARIAAKDGGSGQNGNGINIYRAGNVIVSENRISDCAFSGVRNNAGSNCQISNNSMSRMGEVAIYCEFGFEGAVVSGNIIEDVALGISITNFNEGGRLATVANNVIRRVKGGGTIPATNGVGIGAEADTVVTGNVVEDARDAGISLGWGPHARNLSATGNFIRNAPKGIVFSTSPGADGVLIANNRISGAGLAAISGADHGAVTTGDLGIAGRQAPPGVHIVGNLVN